MKRKINFGKKLIVSTLSIAVFTFFSYCIFVQFLGPKINDNYARKRLHALKSICLPDKTTAEEFSSFVGYSDTEKKFIVWTGFAVKTEMTISELDKKIHGISGLENALIVPYYYKTANQWNFTGIQKEITDQTADNYYIIGIVSKPATSFDKRNKIIPY